MEIVITPGPHEAAGIAAGIVRRVLDDHAAPVVGLATGSSPLPTYERLVEWYEAGELTAAHASAVMLDEYIGLPAGHPQTYERFIHRHLVDRIDLPAGRLHVPHVHGPDLQVACRNYERLLADLGGVDVQVLGIGSDGHLGFNEPGSSLVSRTRVKTLTSQTRRDNARFFGGDPDEVPIHVITQGLGTILEADHLVLIAAGAVKAAPVAAAVEGPVSAMCPASVLQLHPHVTVLIDEAASAGLRRAEYYREVHERKPSWQPY